MTSDLPSWLAQVPMKTVGVLCAVGIFGKNIESRQIALAGKRYFQNAVENVANYALNPILPDLSSLSVTGDASEWGEEEAEAVKNVADCFNYIFHIQIEYFKLLHKLKPGSFKSKRTGADFNLNRFAAKSPTLINSEKRYLILSRIDGAQPYDLDIDWSADFVWVDDEVRERFRNRLFAAQDAYADTLRLGDWYNSRDRNLIIPVKTMLSDLSDYFSHLGLAAYNMAKNSRRKNTGNLAPIREQLDYACRHLERFSLDLARMNIFSILKNDLDRIGEKNIDGVVKAMAYDESRAGTGSFDSLRQIYGAILRNLHEAVNFSLA